MLVFLFDHRDLLCQRQNCMQQLPVSWITLHHCLAWMRDTAVIRNGRFLHANGVLHTATMQWGFSSLCSALALYHSLPVVKQSRHCLLATGVTWADVCQTHVHTKTYSLIFVFSSCSPLMRKKKNPQKNYRANLHICVIRIAPVQSVILTSNSLERKIGWLLLLFGAKADANTRTEVQRSFHPITQQCYPVLYSAVLQSFNANPNETIPFWHAGGRDSLIGLHHL